MFMQHPLFLCPKTKYHSKRFVRLKTKMKANIEFIFHFVTKYHFYSFTLI